MGEGTHLPTAAKSRWSNRIGYIIGGTGVTALAGLLLMQTLRSQPGQAAPETPQQPKAVAKKSSDILARVGKDTITYDMVAQEAAARYGKDVLDDLINRMLIQQACDEAGVQVTEAEVAAEVNRIAKRFNLDTANWDQMLQAERNITPLQYRQSVIWPMLSLKKLAGEQVDITEEEMKKAFVRNYGPRVKVRLILQDNQRRAQDVWEKARANPDDFEKLAQDHSIDPSSRALGGTIPPIPRFSGNDTLETAAFKLKEGEISGLIELQAGRYAILKCEGRTEPVVSSMDEVRDQLYEELHEQKTQQTVAKVFDSIKKKAQVDNFLTKTSTGPNRPFTAPTPGGIQQTSNNGPAAPVQPANATAPGRATLNR
jgi:foldase protein PrsA